MQSGEDGKKRWLKVEFVIEFWGREIRVPMTIGAPPCTEPYDETRWGHLQRQCDRVIIDQILVTNLKYGGKILETFWATEEEARSLPSISSQEPADPASGTECHNEPETPPQA